MFRRDASQVVTYAPDGSDPQWLGAIGHVGSLRYGFTLPGGPSQMSCVLQKQVISRVTAIDPGRIAGVYRGGSRVWDGKLDEPAPGDDGWSITAHGAGTYGADFRAYYTSWDLNNAVNAAISRGLRWANPGISSGYTDAAPDSASVSISDLLDDLCKKAGLIWYVGRGNVLSVSAAPAAVNRLLVATAPPARTLQGYFTRLYLRYQSDNDGHNNAATYGTTSVSNAAQLARHGAMETYADLSSAGKRTASYAQGIGNQMLAKYQAASYSESISVRYGELLTLSGTPVDLGTEQAGTVVRLLMAGGGYGGEVAPAPPAEFMIGGYEYDDETGTASVTPWASAKTDLAGLLSAWVDKHTAKA